MHGRIILGGVGVGRAGVGVARLDFYACWAGADDDEVEKRAFLGGREARDGGFFETVLEFGGD
jgi:hypothetical protein